MVHKEIRLSVAMCIPEDDTLAQSSWEFMLITQLMHQLEVLQNEQRSDLGYTRIEFEGMKDL
jgi:hypothetical protein